MEKVEEAFLYAVSGKGRLGEFSREKSIAFLCCLYRQFVTDLTVTRFLGNSWSSLFKISGNFKLIAINDVNAIAICF